MSTACATNFYRSCSFFQSSTTARFEHGCTHLYPEKSIGTAFFKGSTQDTFVNELEWKQNKGMIFCGEKNVTWHDFYSRDNPRVTLNFFIRELRHITIEEYNGSKFFTGVDGPKISIPISLPDNIIERLLSGVLFK